MCRSYFRDSSWRLTLGDLNLACLASPHAGSGPQLWGRVRKTVGVYLKETNRDHRRGHPHGNAFLCKRTCFASFWLIIQMDPVNAVPVNAIFLNRVSFTSSLQPLNPATFQNNNNNNNGGLHACVCAAEDIEPFLQLARLVVEHELQQFDLIISPHTQFWFNLYGCDNILSTVSYIKT